MKIMESGVMSAVLRATKFCTKLPKSLLHPSLFTKICPDIVRKIMIF